MSFFEGLGDSINAAGQKTIAKTKDERIGGNFQAECSDLRAGKEYQ